jgi:penicillin amidase
MDALEKAVNALRKKLGFNMEDWVYGQLKYKHVKLTHPLNAFLSNEMKKQMNTGILPRGGNGQTPGSTGSADNQGSGASFRLLIDTKDWDNTLMINSPGQSGNPSSPFYKNLFETWANDQFFPAYYTKDRIRTVTKEQLILQPF